ncbi:hypothetical protein [Pseudorhodoferax sp.]|uniref:hypothetical protein n=1 Tax=Pseudorhodoferax sp. TaxID=1993553 RepID=UPI002DD637EB|nr:hypothetical protein [Pseudorhodoferax sp.]
MKSIPAPMPLQWKQRPWRRLIPFQSWRQLLSFGLISATTGLACKLFFQWTGADLPNPVLACGIVAGALPSQVLSIPGVLRTDGTSVTVPAVVAALGEFGYESRDSVPGVDRLYTPRIAAWMRSRESAIRLRVSDGELSLEGPYFFLRSLRTQLLRKAATPG